MAVTQGVEPKGSAEASILRGHLPGLDGLRGVAVLLVMAVHFIGDSTAHTLIQRMVVKVASYGLVGVDLFFVLSGFLITGLLLEARGKPNYFLNFYARRTLRIFPLYYFVLACLFILLPLATTPPALLQPAQAHQFWLWTYLSNFYIASTSSWASLTYVSHFWSLAIEEQYYLLWPFVVFYFSREALERVCIGVILFGLGLRIALALGGVSELSISVLTPCRVDTLCVGAFVAIQLRKPGVLRQWVGNSGRIAFILGAVLAAVMVFGAMTKLALPVVHQLRNTLYAFFFGALILLALKPRSNLVARSFQSPLLRFFGKYSYGLYVYHGLLTWVMMEFHTEAWLDTVLGNHGLAMVAKATIGVSVSLGVALLSFHLLEQRFLSLKRYFEPARS
jgi:peptidoglycan/LPS O-acetylase OafA/YrhL